MQPSGNAHPAGPPIPSPHLIQQTSTEQNCGLKQVALERPASFLFLPSLCNERDYQTKQ